DRVDSGHLLEDRKADPDEERRAQLRRQQISPRRRTVLRDVGRDLLELGIHLLLVANAPERRSRLGGSPVLHEPARRFRHRQHAEHEPRAGMTATPSMVRHACVGASIRSTTYEARIPTVTASWKSDTSVPRRRAGASSAM